MSRLRLPFWLGVAILGGFVLGFLGTFTVVLAGKLASVLVGVLLGP
mgnify:CR=1 FL=1